MDNLPQDIFLEILLLPPVKSLLRSKLVCKSWRSRISNPDFVKQHVARTRNNPNNNHDLFIAYDKFYHFFSVIDVTIDRSIRLNRPIDGLSHVVGSYNGLLCLADKANELYLWNPVTRQIKNMNGYKYTVDKNSDVDSVAFGFGFDHATNDYKAVRIVRILQKINDIGMELVNRVEVYSLKENCWREINVELDIGPFHKPHREVSTVTVNGSIYWLAQKSLADFGLVVLSFDVHSLKFCTILVPDDDLSLLPFYRWGNYNIEVGLLQFKEYVALSYRLNQGGCVIYTLLDGNCWCKNMTVKCLDYIVGCLKTGELIGWKHPCNNRRIWYQRDAFLYDSVNDVVKYIQPISNGWRKTLYHYTESILDLN